LTVPCGIEVRPLAPETFLLFFSFLAEEVNSGRGETSKDLEVSPLTSLTSNFNKNTFGAKRLKLCRANLKAQFSWQSRLRA